jgi:GNAT superfamily N-acetyltransferase
MPTMNTPSPTPPSHEPAPTGPATPPEVEFDTRPSWVPIRRLGSGDRQTVQSHLLQLDGHSRYFRFGYAATDEQVERYAEKLDFEHDELFGIFDRRLRLVAMAHLAYIDQPNADAERAAEFGVSVLAGGRRQGLGTRLYEHAVLHARNRHIDSLLIHALSENTPMLRIARQAGATVVRDHGEAQGLLKLPPQTLASKVEQLVEEGVAALDYRIKQHVNRVDQLLQGVAEVRAGVAGTGKAGTE